MYAIIATGGKQYKVAKGDVLDVEKLDAQPGDKVELPVLLLNDGKQTIVDAASLQDKKVTAEVVEQFQGREGPRLQVQEAQALSPRQRSPSEPDEDSDR